MNLNNKLNGTMSNFKNLVEDEDPMYFINWFPYIILIALSIVALVVYFDLVPEKFLYGQRGKQGYVERCVDGVAYIDNGHTITPKLTIDGVLANCHA